MEQQKNQSTTKTLSPTPLFPLGQVVATPAVLEYLTAHGISAREYLHRHTHGDFGDVPAEDAASNVHAIRAGGRIISAYCMAGGERVWIITEADRSSSCLLFPSEY